MFEYFMRATCLLILAIMLLGCTFDNIAARQEKAASLWPEMVSGEAFGQTFVSTDDNLYRIDLGTATYARHNSAPVIFHLRESPAATQDIITVTISASEIQNERPTSFTFAPIPDTKDNSYYFFIEAPQAVSGDAITVYANESDQYPAGTAYRQEQAVAGDLVFTAYSRQSYTFDMVWRDFFSRVAQDKVFFSCYGILILIMATALLAGGLKARQPDN